MATRNLPLAFAFAAIVAAPIVGSAQGIPTWAEIEPDLRALETAHPDLVQLMSIGRSRQGRDLWAVRISQNPMVEEDEPEVRLVGVHHGDEGMGAAVCMRSAHMLAEGAADPRIAAILATREVWIVPVVNPDGFVANRRENAAGIDINRNYGFMWNGFGSAAYSEPEPRALRDHAMNHPFVLSYTFHTDARYVNYVWNYTHRRAPDDPLIRSLAMHYATGTGYTPIEGADWYVITGDLNDFSYGCRGDFDATIETPNVDPDAVWAANREQILWSIEQAGIGLRGVVTDAVSHAPLEAMVWVDEADWPVFTDPAVGDYHRMLVPGTYSVHVIAAGHAPATRTGVTVTAGDATRLDVQLEPGGGTFAWNIGSVRFVPGLDTTSTSATEPPWALGAPDGRMFHMGANGWLVVDFGAGASPLDPGQTRIRVYGAASGRARVEVSSDVAGPWVALGEIDGSGVVGPGVTAAGARYVRIVDLGTIAGGFAVDAVERLGPDAATDSVEAVESPDGAVVTDAADDLVTTDGADAGPARAAPGCGCRVPQGSSRGGFVGFVLVASACMAHRQKRNPRKR